MPGAGSLIYPATQSRKTCMRSMKLQTAAIGRSLQNATSRNFKKAVQRGRVLRRGNLSLPCPNHSLIFMSQTSCCSFLQTASKKNMAWSAYQHCTIANERRIIISTLFFGTGTAARTHRKTLYAICFMTSRENTSAPKKKYLTKTGMSAKAVKS